MEQGKITVANCLMNINKEQKMSKFFTLRPIGSTHDLCPMKDTEGFQVAIEMLQDSQEKGHNVARYFQYDTIRRLRSSYGTVFDTSPEAVLDLIIFNNKTGRPFQCSNSPLNYFPC